MAKILIVDDVLIMRNILRVMLEKVGHEIVGSATNGVESLQMYRELKPDLVTMDIQMEGGDGMTYLEKIIQLDPAARVIMVSTLGQKEKGKEALKLGAVGYVTKPFQAEMLLKETQKALVK